MSERPIIIPRGDGLWELAADWREVPRGFVTDGGSIPRIFWRVFGAPMEPETCGAFILHDWRYATASMPRADADAALYDDLRASGVGYIRAKAIYYAVRAFGGSHYTKD